jgi:hypothetical protein
MTWPPYLQFPLDWRLGERQSRSGRGREEKKPIICSVLQNTYSSVADVGVISSVSKYLECDIYVISHIPEAQNQSEFEVKFLPT